MAFRQSAVDNQRYRDFASPRGQHHIGCPRRTGTAGMAHHVATRFGLPDGLTEAEAADVLWTLTAPELLDRLVRRRGWPLDRYERWLARTMADALS